MRGCATYWLKQALPQNALTQSVTARLLSQLMHGAYAYTAVRRRRLFRVLTSLTIWASSVWSGGKARLWSASPNRTVLKYSKMYSNNCATDNRTLSLRETGPPNHNHSGHFEQLCSLAMTSPAMVCNIVRTSCSQVGSMLGGTDCDTALLTVVCVYG